MSGRCDTRSHSIVRRRHYFYYNYRCVCVTQLWSNKIAEERRTETRKTKMLEKMQFKRHKQLRNGNKCVVSLKWTRELRFRLVIYLSEKSHAPRIYMENEFGWIGLIRNEVDRWSTTRRSCALRISRSEWFLQFAFGLFFRFVYVRIHYFWVFCVSFADFIRMRRKIFKLGVRCAAYETNGKTDESFTFACDSMYGNSIEIFRVNFVLRWLLRQNENIISLARLFSQRQRPIFTESITFRLFAHQLIIDLWPQLIRKLILIG